MKKGIHREMAFQVIQDDAATAPSEFLLYGVAKPEWKKDLPTKIRWLKDWMDMPDDSRHGSKTRNDHSYKLRRTGKRFSLEFGRGKGEQSTVVARLKYSARDLREWKVEEEYRVCALELAKSIHWVIDFSSPAHTVAGWPDKLHAKAESDFDRLWRELYKPAEIVFGRRQLVKDVYRWAKGFIESRYDRNLGLLEAYQRGESIRDAALQGTAREVIRDVAQNLADYLAYCDRTLSFDKTLGPLKRSLGIED
ncbi:MAG: hypothetical protein PHI34_09680 [Acidobacteriota bacterium]|nr:hypothetical protein [Acidobacteriota bacterium]